MASAAAVISARFKQYTHSLVRLCGAWSAVVLVLVLVAVAVAVAAAAAAAAAVVVAVAAAAVVCYGVRSSFHWSRE